MRGPMIWDNFFLFLEQIAPSWRHISALIHARVVVSCVDVVTLCDEMVRVARFSCRFFTAMAGNKAEKKNRDSSCTLMLWVDGKGVFFRVDNFFNFALWMNKIRSPASYKLTRKLLCLFCREKFCKKTVYSGIELISSSGLPNNA